MDTNALYASNDRLTPKQRAWRDRARVDFEFFCETGLRIKPKKDISDGTAGPLIPFRFNAAQRIVWEVMKECIRQKVPIKLVICKARQFGISTLFCAWIFWNMWRGMYLRTAIAAHLKKTLGELLETMNTFYESFPADFRPPLRERRKGARISQEGMYFTDRKCSNIITPASPDALRGPSFDIVLTTEVSSYARADDFYLGFVPTMSESWYSTLVLESSPKDGFFWTEYKKAKDGESGYRAIFLPWWVVPELYSKPITRRGRGLYDAKTGERVRFSDEERAEQRALTKMLREYKRDVAPFLDFDSVSDEQMYWRQERISAPGYDEERFNQEYPRDDVSCFELATHSAFKTVLPILRKSVEDVDEVCPDFCIGTIAGTGYDPSKTPNFDYSDIRVQFEEGDFDYIDQERVPGMMVFQFPKPGYVYTVGGDVADDTGATVGDDEDDDSAYSVASVYCANTREQVAEWRGKIDPHDFGDVCVLIGYLYNTALLCIERNNMGITTEDRIIRYLLYPNCYRWPDFASGDGKLTKKMMWETNKRTKMIMMSDLRNAIRDGQYLARSPRLYSEASTYVVKRGNYEPSEGCYSDTIIAAALSWQALMQTEFGMRLMLSGGTGPKVERKVGARRVSTYGAKIEAPPPELPRELRGVQRVDDPSSFWSSLPEEFRI